MSKKRTEVKAESSEELKEEVVVIAWKPKETVKIKAKFNMWKDTDFLQAGMIYEVDKKWANENKDLLEIISNEL